MHTVVKIYGRVLEITKYEKKSAPKKIRFSTATRPDVYPARRIDNLRRTKQICMRKLSCAIEEIGCPLLLTLTLEEQSTDGYFASEALSSFFRKLRIKYPQSHALFIPEVSPRGRIHFHGLLFGLQQSLGDLKKGRRTISLGSERRDRTLAKCWRVGFVDCRRTDGSSKLAYYLTKYILKHNDNNFNVLLNGMRMVRTTVGFPSEMVFRDNDFFNQSVLGKYDDSVPISDWQSYTRFTGNISKKKYNL